MTPGERVGLLVVLQLAVTANLINPVFWKILVMAGFDIRAIFLIAVVGAMVWWGIWYFFFKSCVAWLVERERRKRVSD